MIEGGHCQEFCSIPAALLFLSGARIVGGGVAFSTGRPAYYCIHTWLHYRYYQRG